MNLENNFIEEISRHVQEIKKKNEKNISTINYDFREWEEVPKEDIFEVVNELEETKQDLFSKMDINLNTRICDKCKRTINLEENLSGLVVHDSHFLCESCCQKSSKKDMGNWTISKMAKPGDLKPVALWLLNEKIRNRL